MNEDDFPKKCNEILQEEDFYHFFPSDKLHFLKVLATNNPGGFSTSMRAHEKLTLF